MNYAKPCFATLDQLRSLHALPTSYLHLLPPEIIPIISAANDAFLQSSRVEVDHMFKISIVGDPKSGRTALVRRFIDRTFLTDDELAVSDIDSESEAVRVYNIMHRDKVMRVQVWDVGAPSVRAQPRSASTGVDACIVVYDITKSSFQSSLTAWLGCMQPAAAVNVLCAAKADLKEAHHTCPLSVAARQAANFAISAEASARRNTGVTELFTDTIDEVLRVRNRRRTK